MKAAAISLLQRWIQGSERHWTELPGDQGFYGTGFNNWGVQTQQKYFAACAVLGTEATLPESDQIRLRERARTALRFNLASHLSGEGTCTDGTRWGHTWISALGIERMMHGVHRLGAHLDEAESAALSRVLISEADWLLTGYQRGGKPGIHASRWNHEGHNDPESNIWNGCLLWRTASLHPDHPHAADWRERAHTFLVNGVSVEADAIDETIIAGKPIRDRHVGANFFPNYALDHHGYFNVGYLVICASNAALLHFDAKLGGFMPPESLYHHQADLWTALRRMIFGNGRLARIGGDTRVRYAYCQEYLLPSLLLAADRFQDAQARHLIRQQLRLIETEANESADGQFYSRRLAGLGERNPYYFTRLESDRAAALGMLIAHEPLTHFPPEPAGGLEESLAGAWTEPEYGAALHRSPTRLAAFSWHAKGKVQGMAQSPGDGHLSEWQHHLGGIVEFVNHASPGEGNQGLHHRRVERQQTREFPGGFATWGAIREGVNLTLLEGWGGTNSALFQMAFIALPDDHTVIALQHCRTGPAARLISRIRGLQFNLINDFYNDHRRQVIHASGETTLHRPIDHPGIESIPGHWLNLEDQTGLVGFYGADEFSIARVPAPNDGPLPSLHVEEIGYPLLDQTRLVSGNALVLDTAWAVLSYTSAARTREFAEHHRQARIDSANDDVRILQVRDRQGVDYWIAGNFGSQSTTIEAPAGWDLLEARAAVAASLEVSAGDFAVRRID